MKKNMIFFLGLLAPLMLIYVSSNRIHPPAVLVKQIFKSIQFVETPKNEESTTDLTDPHGLLF